MALIDIFNMMKADRYTQDGREEIIKAQEEVEDKVYQIGEISQKTGLQKTANGWVKPKSNGGVGTKTDKQLSKEIANMNHFEESKKAAQKAKREEARKADRREGEANAEAYRKSVNEKALKEWTESAKKDAKAYNENMVVLQHPGGQTTAVREGSPDVEKAEAKGYKKMSLVRPDGSVKTHEGNAGSKAAEEKTIASNQWSKTKNEFGKERLTMKTPQGGQVHIYETDNPTQKNSRFKVDTGTHADSFNTLEEAKVFAEKHYGAGSENKTVASRQLTGDCKIKIRASH